MQPDNGQTSPRICGPSRLVRRLTIEQRVLALEGATAPGGIIDALVDDTARLIHTTPEQVRAMPERFTVGIAHLGGDVQSLQQVVDALRLALVSDGVGIVVWEPTTVSADAVVDVVSVMQRSFAVSYVLAARTLWVSQAAPTLTELTDVTGRPFMAIASDAEWRLRTVNERADTQAEELKPIFRLVKEQAIHLDNQRSVLTDFEQRLGAQSQQLDAQSQQLDAQSQLLDAQTQQLAVLDEARAGRAAAESTNAALRAELKLRDERYAAVVDSATWRLAERLRQVVRRLRRAAGR